MIFNLTGAPQGGGGADDNFLILVGAKSGSIYDTDTSVAGQSACVNNAYVTGVEMTACTTIYKSAFQSCTNLEAAIFPVCTSIYLSAFCSDTKLATASFPVCTTIGSSAFVSCNLQSAGEFPAVVNIGSAAFYNAKSLPYISLPACSSIGYNAFNGCKSLSAVYLPGSSVVKIADQAVFYNTPMSYSSYLGYFGSFYVPSSLVDTYKAASYWSFYSNRITAIE